MQVAGAQGSAAAARPRKIGPQNNWPLVLRHLPHEYADEKSAKRGYRRPKGAAVTASGHRPKSELELAYFETADCSKRLSDTRLFARRSVPRVHLGGKGKLAAGCLAVTMQPDDGDEVLTPRGTGRVIKRVGMRVRVEHEGSTNWHELKEVKLASAQVEANTGFLGPITASDASPVQQTQDASMPSSAPVPLNMGTESNDGKKQLALACPACGFKTIEGTFYGSYGICDVCDWEDDQVQLSNPNMGGGANSLSLEDYQLGVLKRYPLEGHAITNFERDPAWRPLDATILERARATEGEGLTQGIVEPALVYWRWDAGTIRIVQQRLVEAGCCELLPGLKVDEVTKLEAKFALRFPPEVRAFLMVGVPVDVKKEPRPSDAAEDDRPETRASPFGWHNWRWLLRDDVQRHTWDHPSDPEQTRDTLSAQLRFHAPPEPDDDDDPWLVDTDKMGRPIPPSAWPAVTAADEVPPAPPELAAWKDAKRRAALAQFPLLPLFSHRMMPTVPHRAGLPVWSMHGNDCISYGSNFWEWLEKEWQKKELGLRQVVPKEWFALTTEEWEVPHWPPYIG